MPLRAWSLFRHRILRSKSGKPEIKVQLPTELLRTAACTLPARRHAGGSHKNRQTGEDFSVEVTRNFSKLCAKTAAEVCPVPPTRTKAHHARASAIRWSLPVVL